MFNWLGNLFPYSDLHSLNLDWILSKMKETAAQAAKAVADAANALAQVAEAKAAALSAQTAAQNAQTAAQNAQTAADNAADSAENAVAVAQAAKSAAQTAQSTAETAQSTAETAQSTAQTAQTAAQNAQNTANEAKTGLSELNAKFPIKTADISDHVVTTVKIVDNAITTDKIVENAITTIKIADSAVTGNKLSNNVIFGFQFDNSSQYAPVTRTNTPEELKAPTSPGRRTAYLDISTTTSGYRCVGQLLISLDLNTSVVYMIPFSVIEESTMAETEYIAKYALNQITVFKPGVTEAQDLVVPLKFKVNTFKCVKTV